jgi:hypothetical protein
MSSSVLKQIAALGGLSAAELKDRWRDLNGTEPPRYNRDFLLKRLAHRIQELAHGGLSEAARARMNEALEEAGFDDLGGEPGRRKESRHKPDIPVAGTRLVREWRGRRYEATIVPGGFEFEGRRYRSLTAITKAITGTHWNGRAFFGLRNDNGGAGEPQR